MIGLSFYFYLKDKSSIFCWGGAEVSVLKPGSAVAVSGAKIYSLESQLPKAAGKKKENMGR